VGNPGGAVARTPNLDRHGKCLGSSLLEIYLAAQRSDPTHKCEE